MFQGDSAETCTWKFPLPSRGSRAEEGPLEARTPIGVSGIEIIVGLVYCLLCMQGCCCYSWLDTYSVRWSLDVGFVKVIYFDLCWHSWTAPLAKDNWIRIINTFLFLFSPLDWLTVCRKTPSRSQHTNLQSACSPNHSLSILGVWSKFKMILIYY